MREVRGCSVHGRAEHRRLGMSGRYISGERLYLWDVRPRYHLAVDCSDEAHGSCRIVENLPPGHKFRPYRSRTCELLASQNKVSEPSHREDVGVSHAAAPVPPADRRGDNLALEIAVMKGHLRVMHMDTFVRISRLTDQARSVPRSRQP